MNSKTRTNEYSEEALLKSASTGDLEAFNQLVLKYQNTAYGHAYALLGDTDAAEDAAQDGFIKAFQALPAFHGVSFRAWLLKIITNSAYDQLRRSRRHPSQPLLPEDENGEEIESPTWMADPSASIQDVVENKELSRDIYALLDELPEAFRTVITLIDINELDYSEAAEALRVPIGTVKSRLARGRLQMQQKLRNCLGYGTGLGVRELSLCA